jgi:hypothetical protein
MSDALSTSIVRARARILSQPPRPFAPGGGRAWCFCCGARPARGRAPAKEGSGCTPDPLSARALCYGRNFTSRVSGNVRVRFHMQRSQVCGLAALADSRPAAFQVPFSPGCVLLRAVMRSQTSAHRRPFSPPIESRHFKRSARKPPGNSPRVRAYGANVAAICLIGGKTCRALCSTKRARHRAGWRKLARSGVAPRVRGSADRTGGPASMGLRGKVCFLAQTGSRNSIVASLPSRNAPASRDSSLTGPFRPR